MSRVTLMIEVSSPRVYMKRVERGIYGALDEAIDNTLAFGERYAKRKAPVRKVTRRGRQAVTRALNPAEIANLPEFAKKGLSPISGRSIRTGELPRTTVVRSGASRLSPQARIRGTTYNLGAKGRDVIFGESGAAQMRSEKFTQLLDSRGRYELRTQRAVHTQQVTAIDRDVQGSAVGRLLGGTIRHGERSTLGGRLRAEITTRITSSATRGGIAEGVLESPTEYAKYVEFPTSRTAAQPYMRPAREAMKPVLRREAVKELGRAGRYANA